MVTRVVRRFMDAIWRPSVVGWSSEDELFATQRIRLPYHIQVRKLMPVSEQLQKRAFSTVLEPKCKSQSKMIATQWKD